MWNKVPIRHAVLNPADMRESGSLGLEPETRCQAAPVTHCRRGTEPSPSALDNYPWSVLPPFPITKDSDYGGKQTPGLATLCVH